jgi:hypothetical protein
MGYGSFYSLKYDADLQNLRKDPAFRNLVLKYFPDRKKDLNP